MNNIEKLSEISVKDNKLTEIAKENPNKILDYKKLDEPLSLPKTNTITKDANEQNPEYKKRGEPVSMPPIEKNPVSFGSSYYDEAKRKQDEAQKWERQAEYYGKKDDYSSAALRAKWAQEARKDSEYYYNKAKDEMKK